MKTRARLRTPSTTSSSSSSSCDYVVYADVFLGLIGVSLQVILPKPLGLGFRVGFRG